MGKCAPLIIMDLNATSDQQLLYFIILLALLGLFFGVMFIISLAFFIRKKRKQLRQLNNLSAVPATPPAETGGLQNAMSLLKSTAKKNEVTPSPAETPAKPDMPVPARPVAPAELELLSVLFNPVTQKVVVKIDGQYFDHISQVKDRVLGRRILETVAALLHFTGGIIATASGTKAFPVPEVKLTALPPVNSAPAPHAEAPTQTVSAFAGATPARPTLPKKTLPEEKPVAPASTTFNLADEIDAIVQEKLKVAQNATMVKIATGPDGMISIRVGINYYSSVDDVEDPAVRTIIKEAIKEWEKH